MTTKCYLQGAVSFYMMKSRNLVFLVTELTTCYLLYICPLRLALLWYDMHDVRVNDMQYALKDLIASMMDVSNLLECG